MSRSRVTIFVLRILSLILLGAPLSHAANVSGTFRFWDSDGVLRPIAYSTVEIWRTPPGGYSIKAGTVTTDASGHMYLSDGQIGTYTARVFATNYAAIVWPDDAYQAAPFSSELPFSRLA